MRDVAAPVQTITLRPELVVRGSTARPGREPAPRGRARRRAAS
jgi:hypothetical protein